MLNIIQLSDTIWRLHEENGTTNPDAYLVVGNDRSVVIDALETETGLYRAARQLTDKPLSLILTHGHPDHAGAGFNDFAQNNCAIYMNHEDDALLSLYCNKKQADIAIINELSGGDIFDLGGTVLETYAIPGHTPGCMALLDREKKILYSGDALGSGGIWMWLPECLSLSDYVPTLENVLKLFDEIPELVLYPGHSGQSSEPIGIQYVKDLYQLTQHIITHKGKVKARKEHFTLPSGRHKFSSTKYGEVASYCFNPDHL